ncbi:unnamed protein product, partial [Mesorhabditis spiculigera]
MPQRGALIIFEGLDRSGKSTQAKRLVDHLTNEGRKVQFIPFPGKVHKSKTEVRLDRSTAIGKLIDGYLRSEVDLNEEALHLLFCANRRERVDLIQESIAAGVDVVCDRYAYSGVAYSLAKGLNGTWIRSGDIGLPKPDVVLFFEVSPEVAQQRGGFGAERLETDELQRKVRVAMGTLKRDFWKPINADGDLDSVELEVRKVVADLDLSNPLSTLEEI